VLDTLNIERAHVEGQSMGAWVAMLFALAHPRRLGRLIVTTPMGYRPDEGYVEPDPRPLRESNLAVLREPTYANVKARLERIVFDPSIVSEESIRVRQALYSDPAVSAVQQQLMTHYLGAAGPRRHVVTDAAARGIAAPTLVYWGEKNFIPPAVGERLARTIPNARFFCAPATGHWAQFENFEVHNREVRRFLLEKEAVP
jgi:2-hydroxy-6-oxonona-2,4-dienedioate hydrolase